MTWIRIHQISWIRIQSIRVAINLMDILSLLRWKALMSAAVSQSRSTSKAASRLSRDDASRQSCGSGLKIIGSGSQEEKKIGSDLKNLTRIFNSKNPIRISIYKKTIRSSIKRILSDTKEKFNRVRPSHNKFYIF